MPRRWFRNVCSIDVSFVGRNLWMIYCKGAVRSRSHRLDGEQLSGVSTTSWMPSLRSLGFSLRVTFSKPKMKRIQHIISVLLGALLPCCRGLGAALGDFDEINRNPSEATNEELSARTTRSAPTSGGLQNLVRCRNTVISSTNPHGQRLRGLHGRNARRLEEKFSTFNPSADWLKWPVCDRHAGGLSLLPGVINNTDDEVAIALAKLFRVAIMHRMTDTYGPIPYLKVIEDSAESLTWPTTRRRRST